MQPEPPNLDGFHVRMEGMMKKKDNLFAKYLFPLYFLLAYLFSWWTVPIADGALFPYGPTLAAVLVLAISSGRTGLREWWSRIIHLRAGWWYLIGPVIMVTSLLGAFILNLLSGAMVSISPKLPDPAIWIQLLLLGGLWEEPGWTGFALPKLQEKFNQHKSGVLIATLIMALFRAIWHLPLLVSGTLPWFDVFGYIIAFQVIITWLYNRSGGSVPVVMLFHYSSNLLAGGMMLLVFSGSEKMTYWMLFTAFAGLIALLILLKEGTSLGKSTLQMSKVNHPGLIGEK
ncbi:MAG: hypothetical protein CVU39_14015 [Chloroflexi bacterium HGW-Chloroflexi-10]|nr:MAG: hypothetical protein CVU39_14015 [Chloroflexi bacterium HGW-Chloroflexi-10]